MFRLDFARKACLYTFKLNGMSVTTDLPVWEVPVYTMYEAVELVYCTPVN